MIVNVILSERGDFEMKGKSWIGIVIAVLLVLIAAAYFKSPDKRTNAATLNKSVVTRLHRTMEFKNTDR